MIPFKKCERCGKELPLGSSKYNVRVEVVSAFDGFLPDEDYESSPATLEEFLEEVEELSAEEAEADVHVEIDMTLCRSCKNRLLEEMDAYTDGSVSTKPKNRPSLH
jgi:hypothetical protein